MTVVFQVKPLLNVLLTTRRPLTREELSAVIGTSLPNVTREYFNWRLHLLRRVLVTTGGSVGGSMGAAPGAAPSGAKPEARPQLLLFHHSFAEWLLDVKHCTQKYLCSAAQGHAMLAMWYTMRAKHLSKEEVSPLECPGSDDRAMFTVSVLVCCRFRALLITCRDFLHYPSLIKVRTLPTAFLLTLTSSKCYG